MKGISLLFAKRYLFSPKSHSVINIISRISAVAIGIPVAAMVIILSVFNGFEDLVRQMYTEFDPDIAIVADRGKTFDTQSIDATGLMAIEGVEAISFVVEDNALLEYRGRQYIGTLRGVDSTYSGVVPIHTMVSGGEFRPVRGEIMQALVGEGLAYSLGININLYDPLKVYVPRRGNFNALLPIDSYRRGELYPSGLFRLDAETDGQYLIVPIGFAREIFDYPDAASAVYVRLKNGADESRTKGLLAKTVGDNFSVLTRYEQKASMYALMKYEKWGIFLIILLVMVISSFSIIGSLVMLIIEKRSDLSIIAAMGGSVGLMRSIFVKEGMMIAGIGAAGGMVLGLLICWIQQIFGIIKIPATTFIIDTYPVVIQLWDMVLITVSFIAVSFIIVKFTVAGMIPASRIRI